MMTLGHSEIAYMNRLITTTKDFYFISLVNGTFEYDPINELITLTIYDFIKRFSV